MQAKPSAPALPLTVCPTSNVVIANRFPSLEAHPFRAMRDAGLLLTINTDDPTMMELDLGVEYRRVADAYGYDAEELGRIAIEGIDSTWLDDTDRRALTATFEVALTADRSDGA